MSKPYVYTGEQVQFLKDNVAGRSVRELTALFNERFNADRSLSQIKNALNRRKLRNGCKPGHKPGQPIPAAVSRNWFKPEHKPAHNKPVGSEAIYNGYVCVKVSDTGKHGDDWKKKHVLTWETANGKVPDGHTVIFGDGDRQNFDLNNLILISRRELVLLNHHGLYGASADVTKAGVALVDLYMKIAEREQSGRHKKRGEPLGSVEGGIS